MGKTIFHNNYNNNKSCVFFIETSSSIDKSVHLEMGIPAPGEQLHVWLPLPNYLLSHTLFVALILAPKRPNEDANNEAAKKPRLVSPQQGDT